MLSKIEISKLFIAVPELTYRIDFINTLRVMGLIGDRQYENMMRQSRIASKADKVLGAAMRGDTLLKRLISVAPELISVDMVDLLSGVIWTERRTRVRWKFQDDELRYLRTTKTKFLLDPAEANLLRLAIRTLSAATRGGVPVTKKEIAQRLLRVGGVQFSVDRVNLWLALGLINKEEAEVYRNYVRVGKFGAESVSKVVRAKKLTDALMLLGGLTVDDFFLRQLVRAGFLGPKEAASYKALVALGVKEWKVFTGLGAAEGYRRRLLIGMTGSMNRQLLDLLLETKVITGAQWSMLQPLEILARRVNDRMLEDLVSRRFRVKVGEAPIKTFARASRVSEGDLLELLAQASREASKEAATLAQDLRPGATTRSRQYRLAAGGLHQSMRAMWEGVGYLAIFGEREVSEAAAESVIKLQSSLLTGKWAQLGDSLLWQAKAGVDSYVSREENTLDLSRRVYKNMDLYQGNVDKRIAISLLQGKSPEEIARDVQKYISPNTPGGVSYAARRLARTEINNAFHFSSIRYTREMPWVKGYEWNLSGSHGPPDICNEMASEDHDGLGAGIYKKVNVPGKPHPHCLCYVTSVLMTPDEFNAAQRAGRFKKFMDASSSASAFDAATPDTLAAYLQRGFGTAIGRNLAEGGLGLLR